MVAPESDAPAGSPARRFDRKRILIVLAVVILAGAVLVYANRSEPVASPQDQEPDLALVEFRNYGFSIRLPENWVFFEQERQDPQIPIVAGAPGTQNNVRVRVSPLPQPVEIDDTVPEPDIMAFQAEFDRYIDQGEGVIEVIQRQRVRINGVQGFHYLYTFRDQPTGEEGVHSHLFLPAGPRLYTLVFQALPASNYQQYARTFDRILTSFQLIDSESPPATPEAPAG